MNIESVAKLFGINGPLEEDEHITIGHINVTHHVKIGGSDYIIQKINKFVFKNPVALMDNIIKVTGFIKNKLEKSNSKTDRYVLSFIKAPSGNYYVIDDDGEYYRMYYYVGNAITYNVIDSLEIMERTGIAFGNFQCQLSDFDASLLSETIPNFHNTINRYKNLENAKEKDEFNRFESVKDIYNEFMSIKNTAIKMTEMYNNKELPLRVTHNDTKCNNVLFDIDTNEPLAVIDLDTVMPGLTGFDFGDSIRIGAANSKEDETDKSKIFMNLDKFEAFAKGFLSKTKTSLTEKEIETLPLGAITMTTECGVRFLTDYLEGDVYFHKSYENHNLDRAKSQLLLAQDMIKKYDEMKAIIKKIVEN